jgi:hypothetical protein
VAPGLGDEGCDGIAPGAGVDSKSPSGDPTLTHGARGTRLTSILPGIEPVGEDPNQLTDTGVRTPGQGGPRETTSAPMSRAEPPRRRRWSSLGVWRKAPYGFQPLFSYAP